MLIRKLILIEICRQRGAHRRRQNRHMTIIGVIETDNDPSDGSPETSDLALGKGKSEERDRGGFAFGAGVFARRIGLALYVPPSDVDKGVIFDSAEASQPRGAPVRIVKLEHDRRAQLL